MAISRLSSLPAKIKSFFTAIANHDLSYISNLNPKEMPTLLLCKSDTRDKGGHEFRSMTGLQIALCTGDLEMVGEILTLFAPLTDHFKLAWMQWREIFPKEMKMLSSASLTEIDCNFLPITFAIEKNNLDEALINFYKKFTFQSTCDSLLLLRSLYQALQVLRHKSNPTSAIIWDQSQRNLYWRRIVGYLQKLLPVCWAQLFCQSRSTESQSSIFFHFKPAIPGSLILKDKINFYPTAEDELKKIGLGYEFAVLGGQARREAPSFMELSYYNDYLLKAINIHIDLLNKTGASLYEAYLNSRNCLIL